MTRGPHDRTVITSEELAVHLATFLGSGEPAARRRAQEMLGRFGDDECARAIAEGYPALPPDRRREALECLLAIDTASSLRRFVALLFGEPADVRARLLPAARGRALALFPFLADLRRGRPAADPVAADVHALLAGAGFAAKLALALRHTDERIVLYGLRQAYKYPYGEVAALVAPLLSSRRFAERHNALLVMTRVETDEARDAVIARLADPAEKVREAAAAHVAANIAAFGPKLIAMLESADPARTRLALGVAAAAGGADFLPRLAALARAGGDLGVEAAAAASRAVRRLLDGSAEVAAHPAWPAVAAALEELSLAELPDEGCAHVREALRHAGHAALVHLLAAHDPPPPVEKTARGRLLAGVEGFLDEEAGRRAAAAGGRALDGWVRLAVANLGHAGAERALALLPVAAPAEKMVLGETLLALGTDPGLIKSAFRPLLAEGMPETRDAAYRVLARCGGPEILSAVRRDLESANPADRLAAVGALAAMRGREALRLLREACERERENDVRLRIVEAVAARREGEATALLLDLLAEDLGPIRRPAAMRLARHAAEVAPARAGTPPAMDLVARLFAALDAASGPELAMMRAWIDLARKPGDPRLALHAREILALVPDTWSARAFEAATLLTAGGLLLSLDACLAAGSAGENRAARELLLSADLAPAARLVFSDLLGGGGIAAERFALHREARTPGLVPALCAFALRGDPALALGALEALTALRPPQAAFVARALLGRGDDRRLGEAAVALLARLRTAEALEALGAVTNDPAHPLSRFAREAAAAAREEELL